MHRLKHTRQYLKDKLATRRKWLNGSNAKHNFVILFEALLTGLLLIGFVALAALIIYNLVPVRTAEIKVPIATDQARYEPNDPVSGIFFGETYYSGEVRILREVFCKNYKGIIKPPPESADGDFFDTQTEPRKFDGQTVFIGDLPADVPVGSNCVIRFTNVYIFNTPFGDRRVTYQYYTQNFTIVEGTERGVRDQQDQQLNELNNTTTQGEVTEPQSAQQRQQPEPLQPTEPEEQTTLAEPVTPPQSCAINFFGLKLFCN